MLLQVMLVFTGLSAGGLIPQGVPPEWTGTAGRNQLEAARTSAWFRGASRSVEVSQTAVLARLSIEGRRTSENC